MRIWSADECLICGKEPVKNGLYCTRCGKIMGRQRGNEYRVEALKKAYDRNADGFRCRYTGIIVDLDDPANTWHISFDHRFPEKDGNLVVAARLVNEMKSELSEDEFLIIVKNLARHIRTGAPFDLGGVKFEYWGDWGRKRPR